MNEKDTNINDISLTRLVNDTNYYKNVFKKTEKIVSVVFYIIKNVDSDKKTETHVSNIASKAHLAHEHALRSLEARPVNAREVLEQFAQSLIALSSTLRIAAASELIASDVVAVVGGEIEAVLRGLRAYLAPNLKIQTGFETWSGESPLQPERKARASRTLSRPRSSETEPATPKAEESADRRERILTILQAKGEATIKDISAIVTDCSEKTIQRELNAMIEENIVKRQGHRRWSKYSAL